MTRGRSKQRAVVIGPNARVTQIVGNNNVVTYFANRSELVLDQAHKRSRTPITELELLRTDIRATQLVGRDKELADLEDWLAQHASVAVRCLIGRAGCGKTRLAIEACEKAENKGWIAGFVSRAELQRYHNQMNLAASQPDKPTLIIVDDAASAAGILKKWFTELARQTPDASRGKLRILMLERQASPDFGWWAELRRVEDMAHAGAADLIGNEQPVTLSVLAAETDRRALLEEALDLAAKLKGLPKPSLPRPGADPAFDALLANDSRLENEPLFLMMAAIAGVERGAPTALALGKPDLASLLAGTERQRIQRHAESKGFDAQQVEQILHAAACVTLQRGCSAEALMALLQEEAAAMGHSQPTDALAQFLCEALPANGELVDGLRPDLIGEAFVVTSIGVIGKVGGSMSGISGTIAIVHTHPPGYESLPSGRDFINVSCSNIPNFMVQTQWKSVIEVGRYNNSFQTMEIKKGVSGECKEFDFYAK